MNESITIKVRDILKYVKYFGKFVKFHDDYFETLELLCLDWDSISLFTYILVKTKNESSGSWPYLEFDLEAHQPFFGMSKARMIKLLLNLVKVRVIEIDMDELNVILDRLFPTLETSNNV